MLNSIQFQCSTGDSLNQTVARIAELVPCYCGELMLVSFTALQVQGAIIIVALEASSTLANSSHSLKPFLEEECIRKYLPSLYLVWKGSS